MVVSTADRGRDAANARPHGTESEVSMQPQLTTSPVFGDSRLPARFWAKVRVLDNGCWVWTAYRDGNGYGRFMIGKRESHRTTHAPRLAYETLVGAIPIGFEPDHLCRNRACVRPQHLEPVTRAVNVHRGLLPKLTVADVRVIRALRGCLTQRRLAAWFGVDHTNIGYIQRGETWPHIEMEANDGEADASSDSTVP